ncbi:MAG TPA: hypothetical protein VF754_06995, partial [Pyrinomonadaceae bacterium]
VAARRGQNGRPLAAHGWTTEGIRSMLVWLLALVLFLVWAVAAFVFGKGGFVHILFFNAVAIALVQFVHDRRAARQ